MLSRLARWPAVALAVVFFGGCTAYAVREQADQVVCDLSAQTLDLEPAPTELPKPKPAEKSEATAPQAGEAIKPVTLIEAGQEEGKAPVSSSDLQPPKYKPRPLEIPPNLPGAIAPPFEYPKGATKEMQAEVQSKFFPPLPPLGAEVQPAPGPNGNPLTLSDLQRLARANNPDIKRAALNVRALEGAAIQAGLHPNPSFGYAADTINDAATAGFQGMFFEQLIKTAGKLELARQAASVDVVNAQVALRATENDVATRVRNAYFAVLVARENVRVTRALTEFTDQVYQASIELLKAGLAVPYEPMQLRAQVFQVRGTLGQARNSYQTAWKQLASALGLPGMPSTQLAGQVDAPLPVFDFDTVKSQMLTRHTDVLTAENDILRARLTLRQAQVARYPDVDFQLKLQKDYTAPPHLLTASIQASAPIPTWDRNQGNIMQAEAQLAAAEEEPHKVRDDLYSRLADAYGRYDYNRKTIEYYRQHILPDLVRAYKAMYLRYQTDTVPRLSAQLPVPVVSDVPRFQDLVTAQQNLVQTVQAYVTVLGTTWTAVVDVANLLQTPDLFQVTERQEVHPIPELRPLPCCHPCSPLRDPGLYGADGQWSTTAPEKK
jgi:cobalt-zinc-cadmium efflux system outer membrane protein